MWLYCLVLYIIKLCEQLILNSVQSIGYPACEPPGILLSVSHFAIRMAEVSVSAAAPGSVQAWGPKMQADALFTH